MTDHQYRICRKLVASTEKIQGERLLVADQDPFMELWETDAVAATEAMTEAVAHINELAEALERMLDEFGDIEAHEQALAALARLRGEVK